MRNALLRGTIELPGHDKFTSVLGASYSALAHKFMTALWRAYLQDKGSVNLVYWADRFANARIFNIVLLSLSDAGWVTCHAIPERNWAEASLNENKLLEYCTIEELESIRAFNKFAHYRLTNEPATKSRATRANGKTLDTGLVREGFMKAGNTRFTYDQEYMEQYSEPIRANLVKSMTKIAEMYPHMRHDRASYDTISSDIFNYYLTSDSDYTRGDNYNDSRGRAISSSLSKVGNPISCKDFRALLVIPE